MKYTKSVDGKLRAHVIVKLRLTREEIAELRQLAVDDGYDSLHEFLRYCVKAGVWDAKERLAQDCSEQDESQFG